MQIRLDVKLNGLFIPSLFLGSLFFLPIHAFAFEKVFYLPSGSRGMESLEKNVAAIDILAPASYEVTAGLVATSTISDQVLVIARVNNLKVMPLVTNSAFKQAIIHNLISSTTAEDALINYLANEAVQQSYVGWQFDFEHIASTDRDAYSLFIEKAALVFKSKGLILSIAAVARTDDIVNDYYNNWSGAFDYSRIAAAVDFISIMTYDDPNSKGPPASLPFVNSVLRYLTKNKVPQQKISLGIPLYYWSWTLDPKKPSLQLVGKTKLNLGGTYARLEELRSMYKMHEGYGFTLGVAYSYFFSHGVGYIIWHEDAVSFQKKLNIISQDDLRGFSAWALGFEDPGIWATIRPQQ